VAGLLEPVNDGIDTPYAPGRPFLYREGKMTLLSLPQEPPAYLDAWANDVNDAGQAAGSAMLAGEQHALLWEGGVPRDLNGLLKGSRYSELRAVNNRGQAVGDARGYAGGPRRGFLFEQGKVSDLPALPGYTLSQPRGLNDGGVVVGAAYIREGEESRAVRWAGGQMADLNTLIPAGLCPDSRPLTPSGTRYTQSVSGWKDPRPRWRSSVRDWSRQSRWSVPPTRIVPGPARPSR
jgi:probable HAF family extracellular repeat protein